MITVNNVHEHTVL